MHIPVLLNEVIDLLNPKENENFIDCTLGEGGHTIAILQKTRPGGKVLGIDLDGETIEAARKKLFAFEDRIVLAKDNFKNLSAVAEKNNFRDVSGALFDLGMSSRSLEESERGFSFLGDEPLLMNYGDDYLVTATEIVNGWPKEELEKIFREYGEEKFSRSIAEEVVKSRKEYPIKTTLDLVQIIKKAVPKKFQFLKTHPATRVFQALRIAVNDELNALSRGLAEAVKVVKPGGKIAVINFHSLEDRIVKNFFKNGEKEGVLKIITKKPIVPSEREKENNPRARSAKLRAAIKI